MEKKYGRMGKQYLDILTFSREREEYSDHEKETYNSHHNRNIPDSRMQ